MKREGHVCIDKEAKWTHLSCSLLTQTNLNSVDLLDIEYCRPWIWLTQWYRHTWCYKYPKYLSVLVCEHMVVPGVGADQAAKISKTFCLKSALWSGWWWQWNNYVWQWYQIEIILILEILIQPAQKHLDQKWKHLGRSEESRMLNCGSVTFPRLFSFKFLHYIQDNLVIMTVIIELISDKNPRMWGFKPQPITCIAKSPFVCTWIWLPSAQ